MGRRNRGYPALERLTILVALGMLGALLLPRLADMEADTRSAAVDALAGSLRSGAALAHSRWLEAGSTPSSITIAGVAIEMDPLTGFPRDSADGIARVVRTLDGFRSAATDAGVRFSAIGAPPAGCNVTYRLGATPAAPPIVTITNERSNSGDCR